ncbi:hypothetical protein V7157_07755, partial [Neobacillus drentensis]|uniref:hypothetical protein n=1 Tax=Neobacillus drentensis TaxID=220684 RepID=UPI0030006E65
MYIKKSPSQMEPKVTLINNHNGAVSGFSLPLINRNKTNFLLRDQQENEIKTINKIVLHEKKYNFPWWLPPTTVP